MKTKQLILPLLSVGALFLGSCSGNKSAQDSEVAQVVPALNLASIDSSFRPQDDFYHFMNNGWIKANPLKPSDSRYGSFDALGDTVNMQVRRIIDELTSKKTEKGTNEYRISVIYRQAMDSTSRNQLGAKPLEPELKAIESLQSKEDLVSYAAREDQTYGSSVFFGSGVYADDKDSNKNIFHLNQIGLGLGTRDYYVEQGAEMQAIREGYLAYLKRVAILAGYSEEAADRMAKNTLKVETELAQFSYSNLELRDPESNYNVLKIADFASKNKGFDWSGYFKQRGLKIEEVDFAQVKFFTAFDRWFSQTDVPTIKDYLLTATISGATDYLSDDFAQANFDFFGKQLRGIKEMKPRWERSLGVVDNTLGEALGEIYVKRHFSPEAKERMLTLVGNLQKALGQRIQTLSWMSEETKAKATEKLNNFTVKIGYPDKWKDYSSLDIDEKNTYYQNMHNVAKFAQAEDLAQLGKPVDKSKWLMNPHEVNAYYMPNTNEICFPAGILQPPFFNMNADDAVNYGAIGVVIGHEITHGFDDQGAQYDKDGNRNNWWTAEDLKRFKSSTERLASQYSKNIIVAPDFHADGKLTLGENIADQGGLIIARLALELAQQGKQVEPIDGFTPAQRFYLGYAYLWAQNITDKEIKRITRLDPHSIGLLRVNQALQNLDDFVTTFGLKAGDKLYIDPKDRVVVW